MYLTHPLHPGHFWRTWHWRQIQTAQDKVDVTHSFLGLRALAIPFSLPHRWRKIFANEVLSGVSWAEGKSHNKYLLSCFTVFPPSSSMIPVGFFKFKQALTCVSYLVNISSYTNRHPMLKKKGNIEKRAKKHSLVRRTW